MKAEQQKPPRSQRKAQKGMMSWPPSPSYLLRSEASMPMATTRTTRAPSAPRSPAATPRRWSPARSAVRTQVDAIHHCFSWHHADRAVGILAELPKNEPENPVPAPLASWEDYYQWRSLPLHSPVAVLLHWIKLLFRTGFDEAELKGYTPVIHANVYQTIKILYDGAKEVAQVEPESSKYVISSDNQVKDEEQLARNSRRSWTGMTSAGLSAS
ncbi:hypothetical protein ZWY2020_041773 [Hordeum vulgare]|nr:hypothetical protein ZWY2020_041773 [Hordeum vulgare]